MNPQEIKNECNHKYSREGVCLKCGYYNDNNDKTFKDFYEIANRKFGKKEGVK